MQAPTKEEVKQARAAAGLTQAEAAAVVHKKKMAWYHWEKGDSSMDPAFWELFNIKVKK